MRGLFFSPHREMVSLYCFSSFLKQVYRLVGVIVWGRGGRLGKIREVEGGRRDIFTLGSRKMNHIPILLEHVDFLNGLNRLHIELLKRRLQLLVIRARSLMDFFHLSPGGAFTTILHKQPL